MKKFAILFIPIFLFGCTTAINTDEETSTETQDTTEVEETAEIPEVLALVDDVEVNIFKTDMLSMEAVINGHYRSSCETLYKTKVEYIFKDEAFKIKLTTQPTIQEEEEVCIEESVPFEIIEVLPTQGVIIGESYPLDVNGVITKFTIE